MTVSSWQASYGAVTMGGTTNNVGIVTIEGLEDLPEVRSGDTAFANNDGMLAGLDFLGGKAFTITLEVVTDPGSTLASTIERLEDSFTISRSAELPFEYGLPGVDNKIVYCRVRKQATLIDLAYSSGVATMVVQFYASDPRRYSSSTTTSTVNLPTPASGMTFPATFGLTFGGTTGGGGIINAINDGNTTSYPSLFITGPVTNPRIQNTTTGQTLGLTFTLGASDSLAINLNDHSVILNGSGYRAAVVTKNDWWGLVPGVNQVAFFSSDPSPTGAQLALTWQSAWA